MQLLLSSRLRLPCPGGLCVQMIETSSNEDCDDENSEVYPGAPESCDDDVDLNCDGSVGDAENMPDVQ